MNSEQFQKIKTAQGFIAALDQSGGSTPKALRLYGVDESAYSGDAEMYDRIHEMRTRIITSPVFNGERILGSILFEMTMDRQIMGMGAAEYLWQEKNVVPFLKVDKGLADEADGAQVMKPMPDLDAVLARAISHGVFGTKMRSVIKLGNEAGVGAVVSQQFEVGRHIIGAGLVPIIEPEIDIHSPEKAQAEVLLKAALLAEIGKLGADEFIMLKLTLPERGRLLRRARGAPQRAARGRAVRRVHPGGGQRAAGPQPRRGRQLLAGPDRGPDRPAEPRRSSTPPSTHRSRASSRRRSPERADRPSEACTEEWIPLIEPDHCGREACDGRPQQSVVGVIDALTDASAH